MTNVPGPLGSHLQTGLQSQNHEIPSSPHPLPHLLGEPDSPAQQDLATGRDFKLGFSEAI